MTTKSTGEALDLLRRVRREHIDTGRAIAIELCLRHGTTHSRAIRNAMKARRVLDESIKDHWLGAVFNCGLFEWTGQWVTPAVSLGSPIHAQHQIKSWKLVPNWREIRAAMDAKPKPKPPILTLVETHITPLKVGLM